MAKYKLWSIISVMVILGFGYQNCAKKFTVRADGSSEVSALELKSMGILRRECAACHTGTASLNNTVPGNDAIDDITNLDSLLRSRLIVAGEPDLSPLFVKIQNAEMPPGQPLSASDTQVLQDWIANMNKGLMPGESGAKAITPSATFTYLKSAVLPSKCNGCHGASGKTVYDTHAKLLAAINNDQLKARLESTNAAFRMPRGTVLLSETEKKFFLDWINAGAPNN